MKRKVATIAKKVRTKKIAMPKVQFLMTFFEQLIEYNREKISAQVQSIATSTVYKIAAAANRIVNFYKKFTVTAPENEANAPLFRPGQMAQDPVEDMIVDDDYEP